MDVTRPGEHRMWVPSGSCPHTQRRTTCTTRTSKGPKASPKAHPNEQNKRLLMFFGCYPISRMVPVGWNGAQLPPLLTVRSRLDRWVGPCVFQKQPGSSFTNPEPAKENQGKGRFVASVFQSLLKVWWICPPTFSNTSRLRSDLWTSAVEDGARRGSDRHTCRGTNPRQVPPAPFWEDGFKCYKC